MAILTALLRLACDFAAYMLGLLILVRVLAIVYWLGLYIGADEEACRLGWEQIDDYPVLVDVCRDRSVRAALYDADIKDKLARNDE